MYMILKSFHIALAVLAIVGFLLRGHWMMTGSTLRRNRAAKILPHVIDAVFLLTGVWLIASSNLAWLQQPWLLAKFAGLCAYIGLGMIAFRFGRTPQVRLVAFTGAVAAFAYVVGCALSKSPLSWLAFVGS